MNSRRVASSGRVVVRVAGELDMATAPLLLSELTALAGAGHQDVDIDLREVTFCDAAGVTALLQGQRQLASRGGNVLVHDPCPSLQALLDISDLTLALEVRRDPGTALSDGFRLTASHHA